MTNRAVGFAALLAVIAVSIVFGMLVSDRLNTPATALAASPASSSGRASNGSGLPLQLTPAMGQVGPQISFADIVDQALPAVVSVTSTQIEEPGDGDDEGDGGRQDWFRWFFPQEDRPEGGLPDRLPRMPRIGEGSGFIISPDGYMLTNHHVVEGSSRVQVRTQDRRVLDARVIGADPSIDLALLKIEVEGEELPTLPLGDSRDARVGEWVIAIGNPLDFEQTVTVGVISGKERRVPIGNTDQGVVSFLQTDAAINFGNSGGPLLDARGNVIGINTAIRRANFAEGIGFALPINQARHVIDQLRQQGYVRRGYVGITMNQNGVDDVVADAEGLPDTDGVIVDQVQADGPADRAGVRRGDIIRAVDGEPIRDNLDLIGRIAARQPGDRVRLDVFRKGRTVTLQATLVDREAELTSLNGGGDGRTPAPAPPKEEPVASTGLGLTVEELTEELRESHELAPRQRGVIVTDVNFHSEAADKGILPDMLITAVNGKAIDDVADWREAIDSLESGEPVKLDVLIPQPGDEQRSFFVYIRAPQR